MPKVFGIHILELRPGVKAWDFEDFALNKFLPELKSLNAPGCEFHLLRADRGARQDKYVFMMVFDRVETRDRFFPRVDWASPELIQLIQPLHSLGEIWESLSTREKTDYIQLDEP